jgi:N-methylhydantoinase A/oxoprolinase/acetone carboxylase beta subunit
MLVRKNTMADLVIGIDTGGTHTDAVLLHYESRRVLASAKTLTTRDDLARGVISALRELPLERPSQVKLVGISSTLATNSIAEAKTRRVGLLLIGYDAELVERCGLQAKLWTPCFEYFRGGHTSNGQEREPLDLEGIRQWIRQHHGDVDAVAVSSYFSPLDPSHELRARDAIREESHLPVVLGHELSTKLDSVKRAATASLNASLVAIMTDFMHAVMRALETHDIRAPLMIVKGDGSLMAYAEALRKPVETILSGPAASAVGGNFFTDRSDALVIDMGGTTTDIALVKDGRVAVSDEGAHVGRMETAVPAARVTTVCVGCDSRIAPGERDETIVGPERVVPLCRLATTSPEVDDNLRQLERALPSSRRHSDLEYWLLARGIQPDDSLLATDRQRRLIRLLARSPLSLTQVFRECGVFHPVQLQVEHLLRQGIIEIATLTPTDLLHANGKMTQWDVGVARTAVQLFCDLQRQDPAAWTRRVLDGIVSTVAERVVVFLARYVSADALPEQIDDAWARWLVDRGLGDDDPYLRIAFHCPFPIVGIGAPAEVFLKLVAERLDAPFILPPHHPVSNAVGAVAGSVMVNREAILYEQETEDRRRYRVQVDGRVAHFNQVDEAQRFARRMAAEAALAAAVSAGAVDPLVDTQVTADGSLQRVQARAVGSPTLASDVMLSLRPLAKDAGEPPVAARREEG